MANKTGIQIKQEMEEFFRFKMECLNRNPDYLKDYVRIDRLEGELDRLALAIMEGDFDEDEDYEDAYYKVGAEYSALLQKYDIRKYPAPRPHDPNGWRTLQESRPSVLLQIQDPNWSGPIYGLNETGHFQTFKVDMRRNKKAILHEISSQIDRIKARMKKAGSMPEKSEQSPHLNNYKRYFAVWDLVTKGDKRLTYPWIVLKLQGQGFYENQTPKQAEALAPQDYKTACKLLGITKKMYKRKKREYVPIIGLPLAKKHKVEVIEWEQKLVAEGLGMQEVVYKGSPKVSYNKDGHIRKRLIEGQSKKTKYSEEEDS